MREKRIRNWNFCSAASPKDEVTIPVQPHHKTGNAGLAWMGNPLV